MQGFTFTVIEGVPKTQLRRGKKNQSQRTVKYRSMEPGQGVCLKSVSRTITIYTMFHTHSYQRCKENPCTTQKVSKSDDREI